MKFKIDNFLSNEQEYIIRLQAMNNSTQIENNTAGVAKVDISPLVRFCAHRQAIVRLEKNYYNKKYKLETNEKYSFPDSYSMRVPFYIGLKKNGSVRVTIDITPITSNMIEGILICDILFMTFCSEMTPIFTFQLFVYHLMIVLLTKINHSQHHFSCILCDSQLDAASEIIVNGQSTPVNTQPTTFEHVLDLLLIILS